MSKQLNLEHTKWKDPEAISLNIWMNKRKAKELITYMMPQVFNDEQEEVNIYLFVNEEKGDGGE